MTETTETRLARIEESIGRIETKLDQIVTVVDEIATQAGPVISSVLESPMLKMIVGKK